MKLKTAIFYQSVKNWDNNESNTFKSNECQIVELEDHLVKVSMEGKKEVIIVPTANLRYAVADYQEAFDLKHGTEETLKTNVPTPEETEKAREVLSSKEPIAIVSPNDFEKIKEIAKDKKKNNAK